MTELKNKTVEPDLDAMLRELEAEQNGKTNPGLSDLEMLEMIEELGELRPDEKSDLVRLRSGSSGTPNDTDLARGNASARNGADQLSLEQKQAIAIASAKARAQKAATYEKLMAKSRELDAAGDREGARRVAIIALKRRANAAPKVEPQNKPFWQTVQENLVGDDDPTSQNFGEKVGSLINKAGESLTFGLVGDEASAAAESALGLGGYDERRDHYRQQEDLLKEEHPVLALGAELAPAALPGVGAANLAMRGAGLGTKMARGGALGATQGGLYGFTEGEGDMESRLDQAKDAAVMSGVLGVGAAPLGVGLQRGAERWAKGRAVNEMVKNAPSAGELKSRATSLYQRGQQRTQVLDPSAAKNLAADAATTLKKEGVMRADGSLITRDPDARRILDELQDLSQFGLEGNQVKPVREIFKAAAQDNNPARSRIGTILLRKFDEAVAKNAPEFRQGDEFYGRAKKVEAVDQMVDLADTSDTANALRREFQKADRQSIKGKLGGMSDDEAAAIQRVARGGRIENIARRAGRTAPSSIGSAFYTGATPMIAGSLAGSPGIGAAVGGAALGVGIAGRAVSNHAQRKYADIVRALMASGGKMPEGKDPVAYKQLIAALLAGSAPRAGAMSVSTGP